jgi:chaperonin GroES
MTPAKAKPKDPQEAKVDGAANVGTAAEPRKSSRARSGAGSGPAEPVASAAAPAALDGMRLTADRILVRTPQDGERRSKTGLLIPATAASGHKRCIWSDVVLVGPDTRGVRAGDLVLFVPQTGLEVEVGGDTFLLLRERDVQAVASERVDRHAGQYL